MPPSLTTRSICPLAYLGTRTTAPRPRVLVAHGPRSRISGPSQHDFMMMSDSPPPPIGPPFHSCAPPLGAPCHGSDTRRAQCGGEGKKNLTVFLFKNRGPRPEHPTFQPKHLEFSWKMRSSPHFGLLVFGTSLRIFCFPFFEGCCFSSPTPSKTIYRNPPRTISKKMIPCPHSTLH